MALVHPSPHPRTLNSGGYYREMDVLERLANSLPDGYEIFHHLDWQAVHEGQERHGELDLVVMSPWGSLAIVEVKAGEVILRNGDVFKLYDSKEHDVGRQCRVQYAAMVNRLKEAGLHPYLTNCLVLPDYDIGQEVVLSFSKDRIIDARDFDQLGSRVLRFLSNHDHDVDLAPLRHFLNNQFRISTDLTVLSDQIRSTSRRLADGLATWGPRIESPSGVIRVQATAGSGKTQLALRLLEDAAAAGQSALYVCFNRPLAEHISKIAPVRTKVANFHDLAVNHYRKHHAEPDFSKSGIFGEITEAYLTDSGDFPARFDLLIIDEGQDFEPAWVEGLLPQLNEGGRLFLFEDTDQRLYEREPFDLSDAVILSCRENFRSPRAVCQVINALGLSGAPIESRSPYRGEFPGFRVYKNEKELLKLTATAVESLRQEGFRMEDIVVLTGHGHARSALLHADRIGPFSLRKFTGKYTPDGEALWQEGELMVESVFRFKGQSIPAVVISEIDFGELTPLEKRKLFVGLTRAQMRVEMVISPEVERCFVGLLT